ncbi:B12-binding domain-containing radical SAM protein [Patescibacteria group bacterium]|nr:B12-binding domain-containing radical SAM protein [Patescibacteria group bacterium]
MREDSVQKIVFIVDSIYGIERLGPQILVAIAKEENFIVYFYQADLISEDKLIWQIKEINPDIIAYSVMTFEHKTLHSLNKRLKSELDFISIFGGPHYTFNPEEIYTHQHIDIICVGEGERAFRSFLQCMKDHEDYSKISNLIVRCGNLVKENPVVSLIDDLDEVPFADRKVFLMDEKGRHHLGRTSIVMIGRGCPFKCTYCFNAKYNEIYRENSHRIVRWRSVGNVITEMKKIKSESTIDYFSVVDDAINLLPKDYIYEFCGQYKKEISIPFSAQFRANLIDEDIIKALHEAGMQWANCGIETGDEFVANSILKRRITNEQLVNTFRILNKYSIKNFSQNIIGLPVEDPIGNAFKTIALNIKAKVGYAHFTILLPFPKTPIEKYCTEHGYLPYGGIKQLGDITPSVFTKTILKFPRSKDRERLTNLHKFCGIAVRFPLLIPMIKLLIELPPNRFFQYVYFLFYAYYRSIAPYKIKLSPSLIFRGFKQVLSYLRRHD